MISIITALLVLGNGPALTGEPMHLQAGIVRTGPALVKSFTLYNPSSNPIELVSAESGCGCAKPTLEKQRLQPGERCTLSMTVNTLTQPAGMQTWRTVVRFRRLDGLPSVQPLESLELKLSAELVREVALHPPELALSTEGRATQLVKLSDLREKHLQILQATSSHPALKVKLRAGVAGPPFEQAFELDLDESYPVGTRNETVLLLTNDPTCRELTLPVKIQKRAKTPFKFSPEEVTFRFNSTELEASRLVQLRHSDNELIEIEQVSVDHAGLTAKWSTGVGPVATIRFTGQKHQLSKYLTRETQVRVVLKSHSNQVVTFRVKWEGLSE
jgi:hypothetical protein